MQINYNPTYIINLDPDRFGGKQEDYLTRTRQIIGDVAKKITQAIENEGDLTALFFEIIEQVSQKRAEIAKDHGTLDAEKFGRKRDRELPGRVSILALGQVYKKYNVKIIEYLSKYLWEMDAESKKEYVIEEDDHLFKSRLKIEINTAMELKERGCFEEDFNAHMPLGISLDDIDDLKLEDVEAVQNYHERFRQYKNEQPERYKVRKMDCMLAKLNEIFPSPISLGIPPQLVHILYPEDEASFILDNLRSRYVHATVEVEIGDKSFGLTDYWTWMYEDGNWLESKQMQFHPINRMKRCSKIMMLHQDEYDIQPLLNEISKIFIKAITWNKEKQSVNELKEIMAQLWYFSIHNMCDVRGSAACTEIFHHAIYQSLGLKYHFDEENLMLDLEAFSKILFSDFQESYRNNIRIDLEEES